MGEPFGVGANMVDDDRMAAFADVVANRLLDLELITGIEPELDLVEDLASNPPLLGHPRHRCKAHTGDAANLLEDGRNSRVVALRGNLGSELIFHLDPRWTAAARDREPTIITPLAKPSAD